MCHQAFCLTLCIILQTLYPGHVIHSHPSPMNTDQQMVLDHVTCTGKPAFIRRLQTEPS